MKTQRHSRGFSLIEVLVVTAITASLSGLGLFGYTQARNASHQAVSTGNLRQLVIANLSYAADHGTYAPAQDESNTMRWHGARNSSRGAFDPTKGTLSPYLGESRSVGICPAFDNALESGSFEKSSGGYGYNSTYIGGSPADPFQASRPSIVQDAANTLMFATTALAKRGGLQEYPFAEPRQWVTPSGNLSGNLQPSVHFRFHGRALVAWCDGSVTAELPTDHGKTNYYGGDNKESNIGFCGPKKENGWWNPNKSKQ